jgi:hypothetical protein
VIVGYGEMSISIVRGRPRPEVTSPVDRANTVSYESPIHVLGLLCTVHELYVIFF